MSYQDWLKIPNTHAIKHGLHSLSIIHTDHVQILTGTAQEVDTQGDMQIRDHASSSAHAFKTDTHLGSQM